MSATLSAVKKISLKPLAGVQHRIVKKVVNGTLTTDGVGVKLKRTIGSHVLPDLDPFLLLDEFNTHNVRHFRSDAVPWPKS